MTKLSEYFSDGTKRQTAIQLNGSLTAGQHWVLNAEGKSVLEYTGEVWVQPTGAFSFFKDDEDYMRDPRFAQYKYTSAKFVHWTWDQAVAYLEDEGFEVFFNIKEGWSYKEFMTK